MSSFLKNLFTKVKLESEEESQEKSEEESEGGAELPCEPDESEQKEAPRDEEGELEDPQDVLREDCRRKPEAKKLIRKLDECTDRVNRNSCTTETCTMELFDLLHFVDECVTECLFKHLK
ncbi:unnamed protein product [Brassicogethes aeneus]|uniref:Ubiquinol-cytochrome C reductase hinge domain-containing protein n=1 Tax=Brassicogethes aeneus TaxID=1431903 RepID=A0A9P0BMX6_BRAAE|nr:unnamed protein product [Brassicogethes aeneus]